MSDPLTTRLVNLSHRVHLHSFEGDILREAAKALQEAKASFEVIDAILLADPHAWQKAVETARAAITSLER